MKTIVVRYLSPLPIIFTERRDSDHDFISHLDEDDRSERQQTRCTPKRCRTSPIYPYISRRPIDQPVLAIVYSNHTTSIRHIKIMCYRSSQAAPTPYPPLSPSRRQTTESGKMASLAS